MKRKKLRAHRRNVRYRWARRRLMNLMVKSASEEIAKIYTSRAKQMRFRIAELKEEVKQLESEAANLDQQAKELTEYNDASTC